MTLKKLVASFICFSTLISYPLVAQKFRPIDLEFGIQRHSFLSSHSIPDSYYTNPLSFSVIYWSDFGGSFDLSSDEAIRNESYKIICNQAYNSPLVGAYAQFLTNTHKDIGQSLALGATTDIGIWQKGSGFLSLRPKLGLAYFPYFNDSILIIKNKLNSSKLNFHLAFGAFYTFQKPIQSLKIGLEINQIFNGAIKTPNFSMNTFAISGAYLFGNRLFPWVSEERSSIKSAFKHTSKHFYFKGQLSAFTKQIPSHNQRFGGFVTTVGSYKPLNVYLDWNAKLLLSLDNSRTEEIKTQNSSLSNNFRSGISSGLVLHFHRFNLHANAGVYIYKPEKTLDDFWYQHYQLDYKLNYKIFTFVGVLSHLGRADYTDFGFGLKL